MPVSRRMRGRLGGSVAVGLLISCAAATSKPPASKTPPPLPETVSDPASLVNTLVGTTAGGNVFPGPDYPFGMIQWSPDTSPQRPAGGGYEYQASKLLGFSLTHISGPGCGAFGDVPMLPMTGALPSGDPASVVEPFSHTGEVGQAGYYSVAIGSGIAAELTATLRSGMARFTFPSTSQADLLIKLLDSQAGSVASSVEIQNDDEISGSTTSGFFCGAADRYTVYFDLIFDHPFTASKIIDAAGTHWPSVAFLTFDATKNPVLQAKVGISFVSAANARANWQADNPDWKFDDVRASAHQAWNDVLERIGIDGGAQSDEQLFYTSLYHVLLHPNVFSDSNGQYIGFDNQVHRVSAGQTAQYANYSGWDILHGQAQLSALVAPRRMSDSAQSMVNDAAQNNGRLPKWALANGETYVMVGDPADPILAGYYSFGARSFDTATALEQMLHEAMVPNDIRPGLDYYEQRGYLPDDGRYGCCNFYGSVSTLLEYVQADFALAQFAKDLEDETDAGLLLERAQDWQNVFDPRAQAFTPKRLDGSFVPGLGPTNTEGMVEGSTSQYRWVLPFDRRGLLAAMGGPAIANPMLDTFFTSLNDPSGLGALLTNEFEIGVQYWYDYSGEPWKTQEVVNRLRTQLFQNAPAFVPNNDDLGTMSAQLVWSMLGFFPDQPGSALLAINGPEFPTEVLHLPSGKILIVHASDASPDHPYIQSLAIDAKPATHTWLDPSLLDSGATLRFAMGDQPNQSWGTASTDAPPSTGTDETAALGFAGPAGELIIAPGATATTEVGAQSTRDDLSQQVTWKTTGGLAIEPTNGSFSLGPTRRAEQSITMTAPETQGSYSVSFQLTSSTGIAVPDVVLPVIVAMPGSFWPYFNNAGVSDDASGAANFDGDGFSYSAQALAAAGVTPGGSVTADGIIYTWPDEPPGNLDNVAASGQTIALAPTGNKTTIGFLGSATNAAPAGASGTATVTYADGSTQSISLVFSDWTLGGGGYSLSPANTIAATTAYRNFSGNRDPTKTYVYSFTAQLTSQQAIKSVSLPVAPSGGQIHVFDIEVQ